MDNFWYRMHMGGTPSGDDDGFDVIKFYEEKIVPTVLHARNAQDTLLKSCRLTSEDVREMAYSYMNACDDMIAGLLVMAADCIFYRPAALVEKFGTEALNRIQHMNNYEDIIDYLVGLLDPDDE